MSRFNDNSFGGFGGASANSKRGYSMSELDRNEFENTRKMVSMLEKELGDDPSSQSTIRKPGFGSQNATKLSQGSALKSIELVNKTGVNYDFHCSESDEVDDLLDFIESSSNKQISAQKNLSSTVSKQPGKSEKPQGFFDDLIEDDQGTGSYIPSISQTRQSRPDKLNYDIKNKMGELFGLKSDTKSAEDDNVNVLTRPFTSEARVSASSNKKTFNQTGFSDEGAPSEGGIDELNMPFSRRKGRGKTLRERETNRPFTSPGELARDTKDEQSRIGTHDNISNQGGFDLASNYEAKSNQNKDDGEDEDHSEYIPTGLTRPVSRGGDKKLTKNRLGSIDGGDLVGKKTFGAAFGDDNKSDTPSILAPKRSIAETGGYGDTSTTANVSTNLQGDTTGIVRRTRGSHTEIFDLGKPPMSKFEEKMASLGRGPGVFGVPQAHPKTEVSLPGYDDGISRQGPTMPGNEKSFLGEETIKKILKDSEDYYKGTQEDLKKYHKEEKERWEAAHTKEIEMLKREKQLLLEQMEVSLQRERDRLKELHKLEMESKDKMHNYELERQKHLLEEQTESLKKQLEAQIKLNALAEEVRLSSTKLQTLTERIDSERRVGDYGKKNELDHRERLIEEREMKIKTDLEVVEREKQRYDRLLMEMDEKESEAMRKIDREKDQISHEYKRLSALQESVKNGEFEKRRELTTEKTQLEALRIKLEKENLEIKEEYRRKYHDLEIQITVFEDQKREFTKRQIEDEKSLKRKIEEVDAIKKKIVYEEADLLKKLKNAETRELQLVKMTDELHTKLDLFNMEKSTFESEKLKVYEIAKKAREESEIVNKFRMEYDHEKEKNLRMKIELDGYATSLQKERLKLDEERTSSNLLQKTLEGMRYGYVKEYNTTGPGFVGKPPISSQRATLTNDFPSRLNETVAHTHRPETIAHTHRAGTPGLVSSSSAKNLQDHSDTTRPSTSKVNTQRNTNERRKSSDVRAFDLSRYMEELKYLDKSNSINKEYITKEKESLLRNRIDIETVHLIRPKSARSDSTAR